MDNIKYGIEDERHGIFGIGLRIASEHQGKGYGSSAIKILLKYGFLERRFHKCSSTVLQSNQASIKMHKNLGFEQEGILRENVYLNGKYHDEICFGLLKKDYIKNIQTI